MRCDQAPREGQILTRPLFSEPMHAQGPAISKRTRWVLSVARPCATVTQSAAKRPGPASPERSSSR